PGVDELADLRVQAVDRLQPEGPARDGPADRVWVTFGELGRQVHHSRGGLGLAVHHEEAPAFAPAERGVPGHTLGSEPSAGLGDIAQPRRPNVLETHAVEEIE